MSKTAKTLCCIALAFVCCFLAIGYAMVQDQLTVKGSLSVQGEPSLADSKPFAFRSDFLTDAETVPTYKVYGTTVDFVLFNYDDLTETEGTGVSYTLSVSGNATLDSASHTFTEGAKGTKKHTLTYGGTADGSVTITATETAASQPHTLGATFEFIVQEPATYYSVTDHGNYIVLELFIGETVPEITVQYGDTLLPDNTNDFMSGWLTVDAQGRLTGMVPHAHYELVFYKAAGAGSIAAVTKRELTGQSIDLSALAS